MKDEAYDRLKVKEYFKFLIGLYESKISIEEVVQSVGLLDKLNVKVEKLSFSEKRRLHIGRVMIHNPDLIILEEPEQNVDIESTVIIRKAIMKMKEQGKAIFYVIFPIGCPFVNRGCIHIKQRWCEKSRN